MKSVFGLLVLLVSMNSFADSRYLDSRYMSDCGGTVELRESDNGDLALKFTGLDTWKCDRLRFYDVTSGRTLTTYDINGTSYTLSKSHRSSLSDDCRVGFTVSGSYRRDDFNVVLNWCSSSRGGGNNGGRYNVYSYQLSRAGNCKLLVGGTYSGRNVSDVYCTGASGDDVISYEVSNAGNCKRMINGRYSGQNVSDFLCSRP